MQESRVPHILTTSANLLGICFFIITGIHITSNEENIEIMRVVTGVSLILLSSCFLSYLSMRVYPSSKAYTYERIADYLFLLGITFLFVVIVMITLDIGIL